MLNRINRLSIATRLIMSFSVIIVLFVAVMIYLQQASVIADRLYSHHLDFVVAQRETVFSINEQFTYFRLTAELSILNEPWRASAELMDWHLYENSLSVTFENIRAFADVYSESVLNDASFSEEEKELRINEMENIMVAINNMYQVFRNNFFLDSNQSFSTGRILLYRMNAINGLETLLVFTDEVTRELILETERTLALNQNIAIIASVAIVLVATTLAWLMIKSFTNRVKSVATNVARIRGGDYTSAYTSDSDEISRIISGTVDVILESQKRAQDAFENSAAKSRFLASMSHEIRTPISAVMGIAEIQMRNPSLTMEVEEAFIKIYDSAGILLKIINDILDISKIESGKMDIIMNSYELASLALDTIQLHLIYLDSKPIKFTVNADEHMPAYLIGDELRIKQIINNLLSNAFKYTKTGQVFFDLTCEYTGGKGDGERVDLLITVRDTGMGMTPEQVTSLFDEYARFHEEEDRYTQGAGLGMPIVYNFIKLMGGTIDVQSEVGVGTAVNLRIPQKMSGSEFLGKETVENLGRHDVGVMSGIKRLDFTPEKMPYGSILVVDDLETNLYVAKGLMGLYDLQIETASSGIAAIEKIENGNVYDIIFMDHMMPGIDGMEATNRIRRLGYDKPIVALTANALIGRAEEFMKNGFDGFLSKPIQTVQLDSILTKYIRKKQNEETNPDDCLEDTGGLGGVYKNFAKTQKDVINEINAAVNKNDFENAYLLTRTLKGLACVINEKELADIARKAEEDFRRGKASERIGPLEQSLNAVLAKINKR